MLMLTGKFDQIALIKKRKSRKLNKSIFKFSFKLYANLHLANGKIQVFKKLGHVFGYLGGVVYEYIIDFCGAKSLYGQIF